MASTARSPPTSPAARRLTSPPPQSPPPPQAAAKSPAPPSPERHKSLPPSSPPKPASKPEKKDEPKSILKDIEPDEHIPDPTEKLDIDESVFSQITEMDDDDPDCEFSREIVVDYFKQAAVTFGEMRQALDKKDLPVLSAKGHFLKGSSAALGVKKVQESCEHIQHYGAKRDEVGNVDLTEGQALRRIALIMPRLERDYALAEQWLRDYYAERGVELDG